MTERLEFTAQEREETFALYNKVKEQLGDSLHADDEERMMSYIRRYLEQPEVHRDVKVDSPPSTKCRPISARVWGASFTDYNAYRNSTRRIPL